MKGYQKNKHRHKQPISMKWEIQDLENSASKKPQQAAFESQQFISIARNLLKLICCV
jgi:hypothetical protein